jgi:hypothetical protein
MFYVGLVSNCNRRSTPLIDIASATGKTKRWSDRLVPPSRMASPWSNDSQLPRWKWDPPWKRVGFHREILCGGPCVWDFWKFGSEIGVIDGWMKDPIRGKSIWVNLQNFSQYFLKAWMGLGEIWNKNPPPPPKLKSSLWIYCMVTTTTFLLPY